MLEPTHKTRLKRLDLILAILWFATTAAWLLSRLLAWHGWTVSAGVAAFFYILCFIWLLARSRSAADEQPELSFTILPVRGFWATVSLFILGIGLVFLLGSIFSMGFSVILLSALLSLGLVISRRRLVTRRMLVLGCLVGLVCGLGIVFLGNGDVSWALFNLFTLPLFFIGGALLVECTRLGRCLTLEARYRNAWRGFLWGCVLGIPPAIFNLLGNIQSVDTWLTHWWQPLYAFVPAMAEQTWARLFLTTYTYAFLRSASSRYPRLALWIAILTSALLHGFGHANINPFGLVIGSLLFGIPAALLFIKKDLEHAVGYAFIIDFIRYVTAFLQV